MIGPCTSFGQKVQEERLILTADLVQPAQGNVGQAVVGTLIFEQWKEQWIVEIRQAVVLGLR